MNVDGFLGRWRLWRLGSPRGAAVGWKLGEIFHSPLYLRLSAFICGLFKESRLS